MESVNFKQWNIYYAKWFHEDNNSWKDRVALLVSPDFDCSDESKKELLFLKISSQSHKTKHRVSLSNTSSDFAQTGLKENCWIYLQKYQMIKKHDVFEQLGSLSLDASDYVRELLRDIYS